MRTVCVTVSNELSDSDWYNPALATPTLQQDDKLYTPKRIHRPLRIYGCHETKTWKEHGRMERFIFITAPPFVRLPTRIWHLF